MSYEKLLGNQPNNWGRWGKDDEIGCLNFLGPSEVLRGIRSIKKGKVFSLAVELGSPSGDPAWPDKFSGVKTMTQDRGFFMSKKLTPYSGQMEGTDDIITMYLHGTTHFDSLGHVWYGDKMWNNQDPMTTLGGLEKDSILPVANHGIVGSGVLLDLARYMKKDYLVQGETFGLDELLGCAKDQGMEIMKHDILIIRTGWLKVFYEKGRKAFFGDDLNEPGLTFSDTLAKWFYEKEIPVLGTDSLANETTYEPKTKLVLPLHAHFIRNLGILLNEILWLEELANDCANDKEYRFFYTAAPLKIRGGSGAPANPLAIK